MERNILALIVGLLCGYLIGCGILILEGIKANRYKEYMESEKPKIISVKLESHIYRILEELTTHYRSASISHTIRLIIEDTNNRVKNDFHNTKTG